MILIHQDVHSKNYHTRHPITHSHPECRWQMVNLSFSRKQICKVLSLLLANINSGNLRSAHWLQEESPTSEKVGEEDDVQVPCCPDSMNGYGIHYLSPEIFMN